MQDDVNLYILLMFEGTFSLNEGQLNSLYLSRLAPVSSD